MNVIRWYSMNVIVWYSMNVIEWPIDDVILQSIHNPELIYLRNCKSNSDNPEHLEKTVTIIITVWKRNYLNEQISSLLAQTILPFSIVILQNQHYFDFEAIIKEWKLKFNDIYLIKSDINLTSSGRFCLAPVVKSAFALYLDDDVIPGPKWIEICIDKCQSLNSIVSCSGRIIPPNDFTPEVWKTADHNKFFIGDCYNDYDFNYYPEDKFVDYGCNSYFIKSKWQKVFWSIWPSSFKSVEDIHLSASLMIRESIRTIVPQQLSELDTGNLRKKYGHDGYASWRDNRFITNRENCLKYLIKESGWRPLLWNV